MHLVSVVGARPQFVKLAPIAHACERLGVKHSIIHTGQHYDPMLSDVFFSELGIPAPDVHLGVGSGTHGRQTGAMLASMDEAFENLNPDAVLVYGDTNSTVAAALSAVKMHIPLVHLEAGLRSFNRRMPEEHNRVLTDHAADLLLAPTQVGADHLANEGLSHRTVVVGDVMTDVLLATKGAVADRTPTVVSELGLKPGAFRLATIHRPDNTDQAQRLESILASLADTELPVVLVAHPRLVAKAQELGICLDREGIITHSPMGYQDLVCNALASAGIITDSGGLQKEAFLLRVPATTIRPETEWVETVQLGWNVLVEPGQPLIDAVDRPTPAPTDAAPYGTGDAAQRAVQAIIDFHNSHQN